MAIAQEFARPNRSRFWGFIRTLHLPNPKNGERQVPTLAFRVATDQDYNPLKHRVILKLHVSWLQM